MRFVDHVRIEVKAGKGGDGAVAFRREKYVEKGGPSGGDGGNGGSVIMVASSQLTTLLDFRYQQHHEAPSGQGGMGSDMNGRSGQDLILKVPVGTLVKDAHTEELLCDFTHDGQQFVAAQGGRGGLGNMNFATSTRQTPRFAQDGTPGEARTLLLELKLLADVGIIGFPNAGKSTLISRVSRAKPKVADYPFTTLVPNLGLVQYKDGLSFVMADIPGLIEGASEGMGLGLQFLRHVERCRVLVHMIDLGFEGEGRTPLTDYEIINKELARYSPELSKKPQIVAANKMDLPFAREKLPELTKALARRKKVVFPVSTVTGEGVQRLIDEVARVLFTKPEPVVAKTKKTPAAKTPAAKTPAAKKPAAKTPAAKKPAAKKPAARKAVKKAPKKPVKKAKSRKK